MLFSIDKEKDREMDLTTSAVKSELISPGRRPLCTIEVDALVSKCVKRRRRDSSAVAAAPVPGNSDQQGDQRLKQQAQADQSPTSTTTTTTVKRSSRFRGVSRSDMLCLC